MVMNDVPESAKSQCERLLNHLREGIATRREIDAIIDAMNVAEALCKRLEGLYLRPYLCPAGVPTIGWGTTEGVTMDDVRNKRSITREQADQLLMRNGVAAFLEIKRPGQKPTALQLRYIKQRSADGFAADWVDTFEKGKEFIDQVFP
jgi:hypothetical protein